MKIALHGKKRSGKNTVGDYLGSTYGFIDVAFAGELKENLISIDVPYKELHGERSPVFRSLMQVYGEAMRTIYPGYWVDKLLESVDNILFDFPSTSIVITDLRFQNEAEVLKKEGYKLVNIVCSDDMHTDEHCSENDLNEWEDWDAVLTATRGGIKDLFDQMDEFILSWEKE